VQCQAARFEYNSNSNYFKTFQTLIGQKQLSLAQTI
jgi:hypothetical protein